MKPSDLGLPYAEYRSCQVEAIEWAQQADRNVLLLESPPGVGKSLIGAAWGLSFGGEKGFVTTRTLSLLSQYETQLGLPGVRGAANFICSPWTRRTGQTLTCDDAGDLCGQRGTEDCPYSRQRQEGLRAPLAVTSYAYILADEGARGASQYLVCDEGHNLLDVLTEYQSIHVPFVLNPPGELDLLPAWARSKVPRWETQAPDHEADLVGYRKWERTLKALRRLAKADLTETAYVLGQTSKSLVLKPVWPEANLLWRRRTLVMSATLFGGALFAELFNLTPGNWDYKFIPSPFDPARRPFYIKPAAALNVRSTAEDYRKVAVSLAEVMALYPREKGLIHVNSYRQVEMLRTALALNGATPPILYHSGQKRDDRAALFQKFRVEPGPLWLLSPSIREGEDFPYDQARVNIVCKIPWSDKSDPIVAARAEDGSRGKAWYSATACASLAQAYGRGMRAEDDWGHSWILDSGIFNLLRYNKALIPEFLREAIVRV